METIALAGGFRPIADQSKVYVYRDVGGQKLVANYDVAEIRTGRKANPRIYGGDVIIVFTSQTKVAMQNLKEALGIATSASRLAIIP
jgi:polysaccharide export outer membrane protein